VEVKPKTGAGYKILAELISELPLHQSLRLRQFIAGNLPCIVRAQGSSHNHQAWEGGWVNHTQEVMNVAIQLYPTLNDLRPLPFSVQDALLVLFLHDLEKPFKHLIKPYTKENRREWREFALFDMGIELTDEQKNALRYVEGVPDAEYTPDERTMGELAAFCHCCDIISARLWHDKGRDNGW
jgi:hypothetical protein